MSLCNETGSAPVGSRWRDREGYIWRVESNEAGHVLARAESHPTWTYGGDAVIDFKPPKMTLVDPLPGTEA